MSSVVDRPAAELPATPDGGTQQVKPFDAFVSYSHADSPVADGLVAGLHRFARPWYRVRALHVFRDASCLTANPLWESIVQALDNSRALLLLASPEAAGSTWVARETDYWCRTHPPDTLLLVLTAGDLVWDEAAADFDWTRTSALPQTLERRLPSEPLYVDLRWARDAGPHWRDDGRFRDAVATLAATLHGRPKDDLVGEDVREHKRMVRLARVAVALLAALTAAAVVLAVVAVGQRNTARAQTALAQARELAARSVAAQDGYTALALALQAETRTGRVTPEARAAFAAAVRRAMSTYALPAADLRLREAVPAAAWSPDNRWLAVSQSDEVRLWDNRAGRFDATPLAGHAGAVQAIAWSPDGARIATGSDDGTVRLWNATTRQQVGSPLRGHRGEVSTVQWSPDGTRLASGGWDETVRLWDGRTGAPLGPPLTGHTDPVSSLAWSPDGTVLASGSWDKTIRRWDGRLGPALGAPVGRPLTGHTDGVSSVAWSVDGRHLASGGWDHTVRVYDVAGGRPTVLTMPAAAERVSTIGWSPDGSKLAAGSWDGNVRLWDAATLSPLGSPLHRAGDQSVSVLAWSPDSRHLAVGADGGQDPSFTIENHVYAVRVWQVISRSGGSNELYGHAADVRSVAWSPDGRQLVTGSQDQTVRVWDAATGRALDAGTWRLGVAITAVSWSGDGTRVAALGEDGVHVGSAGGSETPNAWWRSGGVSAIAWSPGSDRLASGSDDGTIRIWDVSTGRVVQGPVKTSSPAVMSIAWSANGTRLAVGGNDGALELWDVRTWHRVGAPRRDHTDAVEALSWSPDGNWVASGSRDGTIRLWDARTGRAVSARRTVDDTVQAVAWSPDGTRIASGGTSATLQVWEAPALTLMASVPNAHPSHLTALAWSPNGRRIATSGTDPVVRVWRAMTESQACAEIERELSDTSITQIVGAGATWACKDSERIPHLPALPVLPDAFTAGG